MTDNSNAPTRRLRRAEASLYLLETHGIERKPVTLAKYATVGGGPIYCLAGRYPLYTKTDLDVWAASIMSQPKSSTSNT